MNQKDVISSPPNSLGLQAKHSQLPVTNVDIFSPGQLICRSIYRIPPLSDIVAGINVYRQEGYIMSSIGSEL